MRNFFNKIGNFFKRVWNRILWITRNKEDRQYRVVRCPDMPTMVGMKCYGLPAINVSKVFTLNRGVGHRVITPSNIIKAGGDNLEIYTKYLYVFIKRIK